MLFAEGAEMISRQLKFCDRQADMHFLTRYGARLLDSLSAADADMSSKLSAAAKL